jgi:hypothetical protein
MSQFSKLQNIDQGVFNTVKGISNIPSINLALISNTNDVKSNTFKETMIDLNTIHLNYSDFNQLFFRGYGTAFHINPLASNNKVVSLTQQTYSTTHDPNIPFYLKDFLIKSYEKTFNTNALNIPIYTKIALDREMFLAKSLASLNGVQIGLSLDECINALVTNNDIVKSDFDSSAKVVFVISLKYIQSDLEVSSVVNFKYQTEIPGYSNNDIIMTLDLPKSYSNDKKPVSQEKQFFYDKDNASETSDYKKSVSQEKQFFYDKDNASEISDYKNDDYTELDDRSFSINSVNSGISGTIANSHNVADEDTIVTSSNTLNTDVVKAVSEIIKSDESVVNSVSW